MKRFLSLLLTLLLLCSLTSAFAYTTPADKQDIHVTVYGINQPFVSGVWAVTDRGRVDFVQVWDIEGHNVCLKPWEMMQPGHKYEVTVRVSTVVGDVYINGTECTRVWSWGDLGTPECYATGEYEFTTPTWFIPCWGWMPCVPMWGWRCW